MNRNGYKKRQGGFTLIELLMVISIIGLLSSIMFASLASARDKAREAKAKEELLSIRNAIGIMALDTGLWPGGCPIGEVMTGLSMGNNNEFPLNNPVVGLIQNPTGTGGIDNTCQWPASIKWFGPYRSASSMIDPWGTPYYLDNDYEQRRNCPDYPQYYDPSHTNPHTIAAIVSAGKNKTSQFVGPGAPSEDLYDCDDVYINLN